MSAISTNVSVSLLKPIWRNEDGLDFNLTIKPTIIDHNGKDLTYLITIMDGVTISLLPEQAERIAKAWLSVCQGLQVLEMEESK